MLTACLLSACFIGSAKAQEKQPRTVSVQFGCIVFAEDHRTLAIPSAQGKWQEVMLSVRYSSKPVKASLVDNELLLYSPSQLPSPENPAEPLARVKIPTSGNQFYILLLPSAKDQPAYQAIAISMKGFSYGGICLLNTQRNPISIVLGGKPKGIIKPLKPLILAPKIPDEGLSINVQFFQPESKKPFYSSNWYLRRDIREVHIIYLDPRTKRSKIKTIVDVKPPPAPLPGKS